ncbi:GTP cyclohydrolase I [Streptomyces violaceus]|uniref:GTP cyclohydrolase 1 n=2 Tax=Streptomyces violaceus TaxID=1936 RepID=A0ABZ1NTE6_STRVL
MTMADPPQDYAAQDPLEAVARQLLIEIGEDPDRSGLRDTPERFARWWREFSSYQAGQVERNFPLRTDGEIVMVSDINVWSLCEHHLLPFSCVLTIAYKPGEHVLGLSKFARIAQSHAHRLQVQERLVRDIAEEIAKVTGTVDVAVIGRGEHLCMSMRGIRTSALMTCSVFDGIFRDYGPPREELIKIAFPGS